MNSAKMYKLPKVTDKFNVILTKTTMEFSTKTEKATLKSYQTTKDHNQSQSEQEDLEK